MNYRATASLQWLLIFGAGVAALKLGKRYGRQQADEMNVEYKDATTRKDISHAIAEHNDSLEETKT